MIDVSSLTDKDHDTILERLRRFPVTSIGEKMIAEFLKSRAAGLSVRESTLKAMFVGKWEALA